MRYLEPGRCPATKAAAGHSILDLRQLPYLLDLQIQIQTQIQVQIQMQKQINSILDLGFTNMDTCYISQISIK